MKILYLHQYFKFPDETGGTRSYDLARSFVGKSHAVTVVTATSDDKYKGKQRWTNIERDGIKVNYIYLPYGNHLSYIQRSFVFFIFLWFSSFKLLKIEADVVLATSTPLTIGIPALIKKWFGKTPFIFEVRDVWPEAVIAIGAIKNKFMQKVLYGLEKVIYNNAAAIVPLSTDMRESIINRFPDFKVKTSIVIENIAEIKRFQNNIEKVSLKEKIGFEPRFSVLYAGTFGKVNGIYKIVELAKKTLVIDPSLVYILIGSGAEKGIIKNLAEQSDVLNKNLFIFDAITKDELPMWYKAVSMGSSFVIDIPALWANSANKFFDTLAAGKPVLINHEGWQAKTIRSYDCGYILPFEITDKVADDLVIYSKNIDSIGKQGEFSLELANIKYSLEKATENYMKVFNNIKR